MVETDIANCFSAIPREKLMQAIEERVCDQSVLKLLRVILGAGVMEEGEVRRPCNVETQGGVISPSGLERVSAPDRSGVECARARGAGSFRRRRAGHVQVG